jgi:hypothetical protein
MSPAVVEALAPWDRPAVRVASAVLPPTRGGRGPTGRERAMFVQVMQGQVMDVEALRAATQRWREELEPGAEGFLGGTYGVTDDGEFIGVIRFSSEAAARANSDRPEQAAWWATTSKLFDGQVTFHDCPEVVMMLGGGSDDAGFVQVMQGRIADHDKAIALMHDAESLLASSRPDIMGATIAIEPDGSFTETVFFRSEAEAREGEKAPLPPDAEAMMSLMEDLSFHDLRSPWFATH